MGPAEDGLGRGEPGSARALRERASGAIARHTGNEWAGPEDRCSGGSGERVRERGGRTGFPGVVDRLRRALVPAGVPSPVRASTDLTDPAGVPHPSRPDATGSPPGRRVAADRPTGPVPRHVRPVPRHVGPVPRHVRPVLRHDRPVPPTARRWRRPRPGPGDPARFEAAPLCPRSPEAGGGCLHGGRAGGDLGRGTPAFDLVSDPQLIRRSLSRRSREPDPRCPHHARHVGCGRLHRHRGRARLWSHRRVHPGIGLAGLPPRTS